MAASLAATPPATLATTCTYCPCVQLPLDSLCLLALNVQAAPLFPPRQVALQNGVLMRTEVDRVSGQLTDPRSRFLGTRPPRLFSLPVRGQRSMLALSSRPWLGYSDQGRFALSPLSYEPLDYAASASQCALFFGLLCCQRYVSRWAVAQMTSAVFSVGCFLFAPGLLQLAAGCVLWLPGLAP